MFGIWALNWIKLESGQLKNPTKIVQHGEIHFEDYLNDTDVFKEDKVKIKSFYLAAIKLVICLILQMNKSF